MHLLPWNWKRSKGHFSLVISVTKFHPQSSKISFICLITLFIFSPDMLLHSRNFYLNIRKSLQTLHDQNKIHFIKKKKNPPANAGDKGSIPGPRKFPMLLGHEAWCHEKESPPQDTTRGRLSTATRTQHSQRQLKRSKKQQT